MNAATQPTTTTLPGLAPAGSGTGPIGPRRRAVSGRCWGSASTPEDTAHMRHSGVKRTVLGYRVERLRRSGPATNQCPRQAHHEPLPPLASRRAGPHHTEPGRRPDRVRSTGTSARQPATSVEGDPGQDARDAAGLAAASFAPDRGRRGRCRRSAWSTARGRMWLDETSRYWRSSAPQSEPDPSVEHRARPVLDDRLQSVLHPVPDA